ncbi:molybdopterin-dependent oxidoreductase [Pseudomonas syringae]|nr:molybdopterin-dependent oxidoreductase [Pseudomonas syringae]
MPTEDGGMIVYCSTQNPTEIQKLVAEVLGVPMNRIVVDMRRMGGGFGGKGNPGGQSGLPVRRDCPLDRPAHQDAPATLRRHADDRQAPPVLHRVRRGLRR